MAGLNLLPWRERERERRKKEFFSLLGLTLLLGTGILFLAHSYVNTLVSHQEERNSFLENEIKVLEAKIDKIKTLDSTRKALLDRMSIIEDLQVKRPAIVHLFSEVATALPDGMYLTNLAQQDGLIKLEGKAESNARVSSYMNQLDSSEWLRSSNLNLIALDRKNKENNSKLRDFKLDVYQKMGGDTSL